MTAPDLLAWARAPCAPPALAAPPPPPCPPPCCLQGENVSKDEYNAIHVASTPTTDALAKVPGRWRTILAHGTAVGLPSGAPPC